MKKFTANINNIDEVFNNQEALLELFGYSSCIPVSTTVDGMSITTTCVDMDCNTCILNRPNKAHLIQYLIDKKYIDKSLALQLMLEQ